MRIAVLGAGATGQFSAAALTLRGHDVALFSRTSRRIEEIRNHGGISIEGILGSHHVALAKVTDDLEGAVANSDLVMIAVPGIYQSDYLEGLVPLIESRQALWLSPGTGGTLIARKLFAHRKQKRALLIESATVPFAARITGTAKVFSRAIITPFVTALPSARNEEVLERLEGVCDVLVCDGVLESILLNVNALIHPLPAVLNWGWIESRNKQFSIYGEGMSPGVLSALAKLDSERVQIARQLGLRTLSLDEIYEAQGIPPLYRLPMNIGPADRYEERFIVEDVPVGLVTLWSLGKFAGVETPVISAAIHLAGAIYNRDFLAEGRTMASLGLEGLAREDVESVVRGVRNAI